MRTTSKAPAVNNTRQTIKVLIADDHVIVREGLAAIIDRQPDMVIVAEAGTGREAVELWLEHRPDVALIDLRMPVLDGVGAIAEIRENDAAARLVVLTTFDTDTDISRSIKAGAQGYLLKDTVQEELLDCIRKVHRGEICLPPLQLAKLTTGLTSEPLTIRELDVLKLLALGKCNTDIGTKLHIAETTVKSHLRGIFGKLNVTSRIEAISVASRRGLIQL
jgi:DNA-binding NarL/FixJ family response regulator